MARTSSHHQAAARAGWRRLSDLGASYTVEIPVADWIALEDHPRQRDTVRQSRKAHWIEVRRARGPAREALRFVVGAELDSRLFKVDGHTRALMWSDGRLPAPATVVATIYRCRDREELNELYDAFDTQEAAETIFDRVSGAYRENGLTLRSKRLRSGTIGDALSIATRGVARSSDKSQEAQAELDIYSAVRMYAPELTLLDSVDPRPEIFHTGIVAAALISLALEPRALGFFQRLARQQGERRQSLLDPVAAILDIVARMQQKRSGWIKARQEELCAVTLRAAFSWVEGERSVDYWTRGTPAPVDVLTLVERVKSRKSSGDPRS